MKGRRAKRLTCDLLLSQLVSLEKQEGKSVTGPDSPTQPGPSGTPTGQMRYMQITRQNWAWDKVWRFISWVPGWSGNPSCLVQGPIKLPWVGRNACSSPESATLAMAWHRFTCY